MTLNKTDFFKFQYFCIVNNNAKDKIDIRSLSLEALQEHFIRMGEKSFRAKQIYEWLWKNRASLSTK